MKKLIMPLVVIGSLLVSSCKEEDSTITPSEFTSMRTDTIRNSGLSRITKTMERELAPDVLARIRLIEKSTFTRIDRSSYNPKIPIQNIVNKLNKLQATGLNSYLPTQILKWT